MNALLFDFDGLIIDTETAVFGAWCDAFREHGVELKLENWIACVGTHGGPFDVYAHLDQLTGKSSDRAALRALMDGRKRAATESLPLLPGVRERIAEAKSLGWKLAVASSSKRAWVESRLTRHGLLGDFDTICTREDVAKVKPEPDLYLEAARRLGVTPSACVVFEDSLNGVIAGKAAGMYVVAVPNAVTGILDFTPADLRVKSLSEVPLREILARRS